MLTLQSPEFSRDEADYVLSAQNPWRVLWARSDYEHHGHGPMLIYLAKLGQEILPNKAGNLETRMRFFNVLVGSVGVGFLYWTLRHHFQTSRAAALVGSILLLLNIIRLEETNIIGPHHLMLTCTLAMAGLGFCWLEKPTLRNGVALGVVIAFGALSMTYIIPVSVAWVMAVGLAGKRWIAWDRSQIKFSWAIPVMLATAVILITMVWPPGVLHHVILSNFHWFMNFPYHIAIVGRHVVDRAPRWAALYWLLHMDAPLLLVSIATIFFALLRRFKANTLSSQDAYLLVWILFLLAVALKANLGGARNLLQLIGVLCLGTGAFFDEALAYKQWHIRLGATAAVLLAAANLLWLTMSSSYTPLPATDGYRAFLQENQGRLQERVKALAFNSPLIKICAHEQGMPVAWDLAEAWYTSPDSPFPAEVKYALIPEFIYDYMPPDQPLRRVVADHWKVVWSHKRKHTWGLRLYENPHPGVP